jgi:hypothetical protein
MGWLSEYNGPGAYSRKAWRGRSAEFVYNHIGCPPMLLWLAEVTGLPKAKLLAAKRAAFQLDKIGQVIVLNYEKLFLGK